MNLDLSLCFCKLWKVAVVTLMCTLIVSPVLSAQCAGHLDGVTLDDVEVWHLRERVCNNPSCDINGICNYIVEGDEMEDDNWHQKLGSKDTPKLEINIYSQTGHFGHCWDALGDIIAQCNRNGHMAGQWDYDGESYWVVNNMDSDGKPIAEVNNNIRHKYPVPDWYGDIWVMGCGTFLGEPVCMDAGSEGCSSNTEIGPGVGGCSSTYTWSKSIGTQLTIGGSIGGGGGKAGGILNAAVGFLPSYTWTTSQERSVSHTCNPNIECYTVYASPIMGYSFGFTIGHEDVKGYGRLTFNPYHLDTMVYETDTGAPEIHWDCTGPCNRDIFNPGCPSTQPW